MAWVKTAVVVGVLFLIGWLFLSPPTVLAAGERIDCRPLGWEMQGGVSLDGYDSTSGAAGTEAIERFLESSPSAQQDSLRTEAEAGLVAACGDARENRTVTLGLTTAAALAVLVVFRTRRLFDPVPKGEQAVTPTGAGAAASVDRRQEGE